MRSQDLKLQLQDFEVAADMPLLYNIFSLLRSPGMHGAICSQLVQVV